MTDQDPQPGTLGWYLDKRRLDLGLRWDEVSELAGMSDTGLRTLRRNPQSVPRALNRRNLEKALQWEEGSVEAILGGGDPVPLPPGRNSSWQDGAVPAGEAADPGALMKWLAVKASVLGMSVTDIGEFADRCGLGRWTAERYADTSGRHPLPDTVMLGKIAALFGMQPADVLIQSGLLPAGPAPLQSVPSQAAQEA